MKSVDYSDYLNNKQTHKSTFVKMMEGTDDEPLGRPAFEQQSAQCEFSFIGDFLTKTLKKQHMEIVVTIMEDLWLCWCGNLKQPC